MAINIVLVEPEIAKNASIIARMCAQLNCKLHMIKPLGFSLDDHDFTHGGGGAMEYWPYVNGTIYKDFNTFLDKYKNHRIFITSSKGTEYYSNIKFQDEDVIIFGNDSTGLSKEILDTYKNNCIKIPVNKLIKDKPLSLSTSVIIIASEALRQLNFPNLI